MPGRRLLGSGHARLYGVHFDGDSAVIRPDSRPVLEEVVAVLAAQRGLKPSVEGHTDSTGSDANNLTLSQQRAAAVVAYLSERGVDPARLRPAGFGADRPVADNTTEIGRARNRRVELVREQGPAPQVEGQRPSWRAGRWARRCHSCGVSGKASSAAGMSTSTCGWYTVVVTVR